MPYLLPFLLIAIGSAFEHKQALHAERIRGESQAFRIALWISAYASWATRISIIIYVALNLSWVAALVMFIGAMVAAGVIAGLLSAIVARAAGPKGQVYLSAATFIVWPACFAAAFLLLPKGV